MFHIFIFLISLFLSNIFLFCQKFYPFFTLYYSSNLNNKLLYAHCSKKVRRDLTAQTKTVLVRKTKRRLKTILKLCKSAYWDLKIWELTNSKNDCSSKKLKSKEGRSKLT